GFSGVLEICFSNRFLILISSLQSFDLRVDDHLQLPLLSGSQWQIRFGEESFELLNGIVAALHQSQSKVPVGKDSTHAQFRESKLFGILRKGGRDGKSKGRKPQVAFHGISSRRRNLFFCLFLLLLYCCAVRKSNERDRGY